MQGIPEDAPLPALPSSRPANGDGGELAATMANLMQRALAADVAEFDEEALGEDNPPAVPAKARTRREAEMAEEEFPSLPADVAENLALMDPDNPLMKRVQDALHKQLVSADERLTLELREKEESLKKVKAQREEIGVELYALQQQLAKVQAHLEESHASYSVIKSHRERAEASAAETRAAYERERATLAAAAKALETRKSELESVSRLHAQVQLFQDEMKSRLSTTRRVTLKSEEDLVKQEAEKRKQDFYIHTLTGRLERLRDTRATLDHQIGTQQAEIRTLHSAIQEANAEMDAIVFEKRQLFHQWKSGLIGMQRRQEVLGAMDEAVRRETEVLLTMDTELAGFKTALAALAVENETLALLHDKLHAESGYLTAQIKSLGERRDVLKQQYGQVQRALEAAEAEAKRVSHQRQSLTNEVNALKKQVLTAQQKAAKLEREIAEQIQLQLGIDKDVAGTLKDAKKLTAAIHEKEATIAACENNVAAIKLDGSRVSDTIRALRGELGDLDRAIAGKNETIEKYELEIRRGNDEMVKKQSEIDLLNKKLNQILMHSTDEAIGPLEATIHNLTKSIAAKEKECWDLQQFWLRTQNELVVASKRASEMAEAIATLKMRHTILARKRAMVNQEFDGEEAEMKIHQRSIKALQNEMTKINTLISKQVSMQAVLGESTLGLEQEFRYRLKEAELEAVRLEQQVRDLKHEKDRALGGLLDMEQQIMLWEKKIQLAKETREALDPNIGAQEIQEMTAEIHRMELRLANLQKVQEKLITDMEKGVVRRETIAVRAKLRGKGYTQASLNKAIAELNKQLKAVLVDLRDVDRDMATISGALARVKAQVAEGAAVLDAMRRDQAALVGEIQVKMDLKTALFTEISMWQKKGKRYQTIKDGKYAFVRDDPAARQAELDRAMERLDKVEKAVHIIITESPQQLGPASKCLETYLTSARSFVA
ncbi:Coiled-coil domain-containing protein 40 [Blastocladiella emersonii ATCC 22665]|nr:Coiled-coil domain-containing protein 40 [Blastocladiella emersonii ATCC 22665]